MSISTGNPMTPVSITDTPNYQQGRLDAFREVQTFINEHLEGPRFGVEAYYIQQDSPQSGEAALGDLEAVIEGIGDLAGVIMNEMGYATDRLRKAGVVTALPIEGEVVE